MAVSNANQTSALRQVERVEMDNQLRFNEIKKTPERFSAAGELGSSSISIMSLISATFVFVLGVGWAWSTAVPPAVPPAVGLRSGASVLVFLSPSCPCSGDQLLEFTELVQAYEPRGIRFVSYGLDSAHSGAAISEQVLAQRKGFNAALGESLKIDWANAQRAADIYGVEKTPFAVLLDDEGQVVYRGGILSFDEKPVLRSAIEDWRARRKIRLSESKSLGCAIRATFEVN